MSDLEPVKQPGSIARKRQKGKLTAVDIPAITSQNLEKTLEDEIGAVEGDAVIQGYNVAIALQQAKQRGFATGITLGMTEGNPVTESFFRSCIGAAGASLG